MRVLDKYRPHFTVVFRHMDDPFICQPVCCSNFICISWSYLATPHGHSLLSHFLLVPSYVDLVAFSPSVNSPIMTKITPTRAPRF
jgi:hypothetical protein